MRAGHQSQVTAHQSADPVLSASDRSATKTIEDAAVILPNQTADRISTCYIHVDHTKVSDLA